MKKILLFFVVFVLCNSGINAQLVEKEYKVDKDTTIIIPLDTLKKWGIDNAYKKPQADGSYIHVRRNVSEKTIILEFFNDSIKKNEKDKNGKLIYEKKETFRDFKNNEAKDILFLKDSTRTVKITISFFKKEDLVKEDSVKMANVNLPNNSSADSTSTSLNLINEDITEPRTMLLDDLKKDLEIKICEFLYYIIGIVAIIFVLLFILFKTKMSKRNVPAIIDSSILALLEKQLEKEELGNKVPKESIDDLLKPLVDRITILENNEIFNEKQPSRQESSQSKVIKEILNPPIIEEKIMFCDQLDLRNIKESCFQEKSNPYCYYKIVIVGEAAKYYINDDEKVQSTLAQMAGPLYEYTKYENRTDGKTVSAFETAAPGELEKNGPMWVEKVRIKVIAK
ncbi:MULTISPECIES: hypothetical protein [Bacteroides]|jgi:hypothetical protein|uniref:hypothetical protein n=1 Tax=Bacteroides TaxID=816 RepID=UPI002108B521|nr:hypothetical protein [Bacteroides nordii]MCQ4913482.1 hypothetical protein [Bacteroides nordii]